MQDITDIVKETEFQVFKKPIDQGGIVKCIKVDGVKYATRFLNFLILPFSLPPQPTNADAIISKITTRISINLKFYLETIIPHLQKKLNYRLGW